MNIKNINKLLKKSNKDLQGIRNDIKAEVKEDTKQDTKEGAKDNNTQNIIDIPPINIIDDSQRSKDTPILAMEDKNLRLMSIITVTGIFLLLLGYLIKFMKEVFSSLYINKSIPLGIEHFLIITIITSLAVTVFYSIYYCYSEFQCFCKYEFESILINLEKKANKNFVLLISIFKYNLIISVIVIVLSFPFTEIRSAKIAILVDSIILIIILFICGKNIKNQVQKFNHKFVALRHVLIFSLIWIMTSVFIFEVGVGSLLNINKNIVTIKFNNDKEYPMEITQIKDIPSNLNITIYTKSGHKNIIINDSNMKSSFVEVTQETLNSPNKQETVQLNKNYYEYLYTINLKKYLEEGRNQIEIKFESDSFPNMKSKYRIVNEITYTNGYAEFLKKDFMIDLQ